MRVAGEFDLLLGDLEERVDFRVVDDGGVEAAGYGFGEEDGVEDAASVGVEAERDVGDPQGGLALGELEANASYCLQSLDAGGAVVLLAGGDGQGQGVKDEVLRRRPYLLTARS